MTTFFEIDAAASKAASRYARRVWYADRTDLKQQAITAAMDAAKTFDPTVGVPASAYLFRACILHLRAYLWRASAPVSETSNRLATLRGVHRANLDDADDRGEIASRKDAEEAFDEALWLSEVKEQLADAIDDIPDVELAMQVFIEEKKPAAVAAALSVDVKRVYRATRAVRKRVSEDAQLYELLKRKK